MLLQGDIIQKLKGKTYISIVYARSFFYQFLMHLSYQERFIIISYYRLERPIVALIGDKNSPAYIQQFIDQILRNYQKYAIVYINNIIIFLDSLEEHLQHLSTIFLVFANYNLALLASKSFLGYPFIQLLGFCINSIRLINTTERIYALLDIEFPNTLQKLEKQIRLINQLCYLVPFFA